MSDEQNTYRQDKREFVPLVNLYLDPNNFRFIDHSDYANVPEQRITEAQVQRGTQTIILGKYQEGIEDLLESFKANGYLPVDQILVRPLNQKENKYLVIEGNRRVAALKFLWDKHKNGIDIGNLNPAIFEGVPVVVSENVSPSHAKILMGLKHISGNKRWPSINQAQFIKSLQKDGLSDEQIMKSLGIKTQSYRRFQRALGLIEQYKDSDYGDQFESNKFNLFEEITKHQSFKDWLAWSDETMSATNARNRERLFSWISTDERLVDEDDEEKGRETLDPIIVRGADARNLAKFILDEQAVERMEETRSVSEAYSQSDALSKDKFDNTLNVIEKQLDMAFAFSKYAPADSESRLMALQDKFAGLLKSKGLSDINDSAETNKTILINTANEHLSELNIGQYKGLINLVVPNIRRINIIAGNNNAGKSTLLEIIYALIIQNDLASFLEIQKRRAKFPENLPAIWTDKQFPAEIRAKGTYMGRPVGIAIDKEQEEEETFDKSGYLSSIQTEAFFGTEKTESKIRLFENKDSQLYYSRLVHVCNIRYTNPFSMQRAADLLKSHVKSVEEKVIDRIIDFLAKYIDKDIQKIELVQEAKNLYRFLVTHKTMKTPLDITQFGDGLQRIFYITLQFAAARNGILLIDEIENAIHHGLFVHFVSFIQELSKEFNVQLFMTSHNKEYIDALFSHEDENQHISAYRLEKIGGNIRCLYEEGARYGRLIKNFNADIRGGGQ